MSKQAIPSHPVLKGEKIYLRPTLPEDADSFFAIFQDEDVMRLTGTQERYSLEQIRAHYQRIQDDESRIDYSIILPESGQVIGEVVLNEIDRRNNHAGFRITLVSSALCGKGYGTEATRLAMYYAFEVLELHRVALEVYAFNARAHHVYEKCGFVIEGICRHALLWEGVYYDAIMMGMLKTDYVALKNKDAKI